MNTVSEEMKHILDAHDKNHKKDGSGAEITSVLMLQKRGKSDAEIDSQMDFTVAPYIRKQFTLKNSANTLTLSWNVPTIGTGNPENLTGVLDIPQRGYFNMQINLAEALEQLASGENLTGVENDDFLIEIDVKDLFSSEDLEGLKNLLEQRLNWLKQIKSVD